MLAPSHHKPQGWTLKVGRNQRVYIYLQEQGKSHWKPHAFVTYCIALESLGSSSAATNIYPHAACALLHQG